MAGSLRKVTLDGQTFNVAADANLSQTAGQEKEGIRHTGGTTIKTTLKTATVESVDLIVDGNQFLDLQELAERNVAFPMSYEEESGDVWRAQGQINLDARETETTKVSVVLIPVSKWEAFLA